jgi:(p)ppGpp synthase/HD superfamily hydrolase
LNDLPQLTERFEDALVHATRLHTGQRRKGGRVPYAAHLLGVASIVLDHGGDEDQAIAALLHDAVEDCGGLPRLEEISRRFGKRVARIVDGCTDSYETPPPPWLERKQQYVRRAQDEEEDTLLVSCADKLHNTQALLRHLRRDGEEAWALYRGGKQGTLWYYRTLADLFLERVPGILADELNRVVREVEDLTGAGD